MQITEQTDDRLTFTQQVNETRWIAVLGVIFFLGLGAFFYNSGDDGARIFAYGFGGAGLFFVAMLFVKPPRAQVIFDRTEGVMIVRTPRGTARRVKTVELDQIAGLRMRKTRASDYGNYSQVIVQMAKDSGKSDIPLPANFSGMSQELILETISTWATRTGAFPATPVED